jgi:hypothetical protein
VSLGGQPLSGELQLALAVLEDCVRTLMTSRGRSSAPLRRDLAWIESRERRAPFAFEHLCEVLQIDADRLRRRVLTAVGPSAAPPVGPTERVC